MLPAITADVYGFHAMPIFAGRAAHGALPLNLFGITGCRRIAAGVAISAFHFSRRRLAADAATSSALTAR